MVVVCVCCVQQETFFWFFFSLVEAILGPIYQASYTKMYGGVPTLQKQGSLVFFHCFSTSFAVFFSFSLSFSLFFSIFFFLFLLLHFYQKINFFQQKKTTKKQPPKKKPAVFLFFDQISHDSLNKARFRQPPLSQFFHLAKKNYSHTPLLPSTTNLSPFSPNLLGVLFLRR